MNNLSNFGEILFDLMQSENITQKQLTLSAKINKSTLSKYLNDKFMPSTKNLIMLSNFFNCSIDYMLGFKSLKEISFSKNPITFYERYTFLLNTKEITNYKASKDLHMALTNKYNWQNGDLPNPKTLKSLANYFNCSIDFLVGLSDVI